MKKLLILTAIFCLSFISSAFSSSTPMAITWQGRLTQQGQIVNGTRAMRFAIVNGAGIVKWQSAAADNNVTVTVNNSIYSVKLGDTSLTNMAALTTTAFDQGEELYLRMWIEGAQLSPDVLYSSVPYALISRLAETITANNTAGNSIVAAIGLSDNNVGIGTANPTSQLVIHKEATDGTATLELSALNAADTKNRAGISYKAAGRKLAFDTNLNIPGNEVMVLSAGKLGVGTLTPNTLLEIADETPFIRLTDTIDQSWAFGDTFGGIEFYSADTHATYGNHVGAYIKAQHLRAGTGHSASDMGLAFGITGPNGGATPYLTPYTAMVIDNKANVGIGTETPAEKLEVNGNIKASQLTGAWDNSASGYIRLGDTQICWGTKSSSSWPQAITYPVAFISAPAVTISAPRSGYYTTTGTSNNGPTTTGFNLYIVNADTIAACASETNAHWIAIGQWR